MKFISRGVWLDSFAHGFQLDSMRVMHDMRKDVPGGGEVRPASAPMPDAMLVLTNVGTGDGGKSRRPTITEDHCSFAILDSSMSAWTNTKNLTRDII